MRVHSINLARSFSPRLWVLFFFVFQHLFALVRACKWGSAGLGRAGAMMRAPVNAKCLSLLFFAFSI